MTRGRIAIYSLVLVLVASLLLAANARAGPRDWSILRQADWTNAKTSR